MLSQLNISFLEVGLSMNLGSNLCRINRYITSPIETIALRRLVIISTLANTSLKVKNKIILDRQAFCRTNIKHPNGYVGLVTNSEAMTIVLDLPL